MTQRSSIDLFTWSERRTKERIGLGCYIVSYIQTVVFVLLDIVTQAEIIALMTYGEVGKYLNLLSKRFPITTLLDYCRRQ